MPQPVKITNNIVSGSIKRGTISYAIEGQGRDYSTLDSGDWYSGVLPEDGRWIIISESSAGGTPSFWITADDTNNALLTTINGLPARYNQTAFTDTGSALAFLASSDRYVVLRSVPDNSDADALVLSVDASNLSSYPRTGTTWYDLSGYGANGTLINGPTFNSNGWVDFDGTNDYTQIVGTGFQNDVLPSSSYVDRTATFMATVKFDTTANAGAVITRWGNSLGQTWWFGRYGGGGTIHLALDTSTGYKPFFSNSSVGTNTSRFYHIAATVNGGNYTFYNNGEEDGTGTYTGNWDVPPLCPVLLGAQNTGSAVLLNGKIASAKVYSRTLSATDIKQNYYGGPIVTDGLVFAVDAGNLVSYENGSATTYSLTGSVSGTLTNGVGFDSANGGGWVFDGVDDYINFGTNTLISDDFSVEFWFDIIDSPISKEHFIFNYGYSSNSSFLLVLNTVNNGTYSIQPYYRNDAGTVNGYGLGSGTLGSTNHLVIIRESGVNRAYVNGVDNGLSFVNSTTLVSDLNVQLGWAIPRNKAGAYFEGNIYTSRIYNRALTAEEVAQNYSATKQKYQL